MTTAKKGKTKKRLKGRITFVEISPYKFSDQKNAAERHALRFCYEKSLLQKKGKFDISFVRVMDTWSKTPKKKEVEPFIHTLNERIRATKPDVVIILGKHVAKLVGRTDKIDSNRGYWNPTSFFKHQHLITYSGDEVMSDWSKCYSVILDFDKVYRYFKKGKKFRAINPKSKMKRGSFKVCKTVSAVRKALEKCRKSDLVALDTETTGLKFWKEKILCISLSHAPGKGFAIPLGQHRGGNEEIRCHKFWTPSKLKRVKRLLRDFFFGETKFVLQNGKFDMLFFRKYKMRPKNVVWDTMSAAKILNENIPSNLNYLCQLYKVKYEKYDESILEYVNPDDPKCNYADVPNEVLWTYAIVDVDVTRKVALKQMKEIEKFPALKKLLLEIQLPLNAVFEKVEFHGVKVNTKRMRKLVKVYSEAAIKADQTLRKSLAKHPRCKDLDPNEFNIDSPKQVVELLYERMELPLVKQTKSGNESADADTLDELAKKTNSKLDKTILISLKNAKKCRTIHDRIVGSAYRGKKSEGYQGYIDKKGYAHTNYQIDYVVSGRLSSRGINLQNVENHRNLPLGYDGPGFGELFIPHKKANDFVSIDYSQMELRAGAMLSGDQALLEEFNLKLDIHSRNARMFWGLPDDAEVSDEKRSNAKPVSFGTQYGGAEGVIMKETGCTKEEASRLLQLYWAKYHQLKRWRENKVVVAKKKGYIETYHFKRRRLVGMGFDLYNYLLNKVKGPGTTGTRRWIAKLRGHIERQIYNFPVQSFCADVMNSRIIELDKYLERYENAWIVLQVHDEVSLDVPSKHRDKIIKDAVKILEWHKVITPIKKVRETKKFKSVNLTVDVKHGKHWKH